MQINRRITNGLAWAGAVLIVAIPAADFAVRQFSGGDTPQVAIIQEEPVTQPTPATERPAAAAQTPAPATDRVETASTATPQSSGSGSAVDSFIQSGRPLPSYISDGGTAPTTSAPANPRPAANAPAQNPATATANRPAQPAASTPPRENVASVPPTRLVTLPTPVSQRPQAVATVTPPASSSAPPLVIDRPGAALGSIRPQAPAPSAAPGGIVTADDLADWESGPLSDFLANRQQGGSATRAPSNYDPNGFFLEQGPNTRRGQQFPSAYSDDDDVYYFYPLN